MKITGRYISMYSLTNCITLREREVEVGNLKINNKIENLLLMIKKYKISKKLFLFILKKN